MKFVLFSFKSLYFLADLFQIQGSDVWLFSQIAEPFEKRRCIVPRRNFVVPHCVVLLVLLSHRWYPKQPLASMVVLSVKIIDLVDSKTAFFRFEITSTFALIRVLFTRGECASMAT